MAGKKRTRCMKFAPHFLLMLVLVAADKARPDPKCPAGQVFDSGSIQCRHCGLCCLEHQQQMGCLEQGIDSAHSCFYDASCQDERNLHPAAKVRTWDWQTIALIASCAAVGLTLILVLLLLVKPVKKRWTRWRQRQADPEDQGTRPLVEEGDSEASHSAETQGAENQKAEGPKEPSNPSSSLQGASIATPGSQHGVSPGPSHHPARNRDEEPSTSDLDQTTPMKLGSYARDSELPSSSSELPNSYPPPPVVSLHINA